MLVKTTAYPMDLIGRIYDIDYATPWTGKIAKRLGAKFRIRHGELDIHLREKDISFIALYVPQSVSP